jgi:hypothetical protein
MADLNFTTLTRLVSIAAERVGHEYVSGYYDLSQTEKELVDALVRLAEGAVDAERRRD